MDNPQNVENNGEFGAPVSLGAEQLQYVRTNFIEAGGMSDDCVVELATIRLARPARLPFIRTFRKNTFTMKRGVSFRDCLLFDQ